MKIKILWKLAKKKVTNKKGKKKRNNIFGEVILLFWRVAERERERERDGMILYNTKIQKEKQLK